MWFLVLSAILAVIFGYKIYKIGYFYDYKYLRNVIRFFMVYSAIAYAVWIVVENNIILSFNYKLFIFGVAISLISGILCYIYQLFLVNKFGTEERFTGEYIVETDDTKK